MSGFSEVRLPLFAVRRAENAFFGNTEVIIGERRSLIRNAVYLSSAETSENKI